TFPAGPERSRSAPPDSDTTIVALAVDRPPYLLCGTGHVDMTNAEMRNRIEHRVVHRRRRSDRARFADALRAERIDVRRRDRVIERERGQLGGAHECVVGEVAREQ